MYLIYVILSLAFSDFLKPSVEVAHALYLSVIEIDNRDSSREVGVNIKVFESDIADALKNEFKKTFDLEDSKVCIDRSAEIEEYFSKHLSIRINDRPLNLELTSCEKNSDSIWLYFKMLAPTDWKDFEVKADFLMELFPTQSNVVSIYHGDQKKFLRITSENKIQKVSF